MSKKTTKNQSLNTGQLFEELEPRILLNADLPGLDSLQTSYDQSAIEFVVQDDAANSDIHSDSANAGNYTTHEVILVDENTPDYHSLIDDILSSSDESQQYSIFLVSAEQDGITQISEILSGFDDLDAMHLISHASDGSIQLGNTRLDSASLQENFSTIQAWGNAFSDEADLLIYGCNLAASEDGQHLVDALGQLTGADVAASTDLTGSAYQGGDWVLEYQFGQIQTEVAIGSFTQTGWQGVLVVPTSSDDSFSGNEDNNITGNVISNDSNSTGATTVSGPSNGSLTLNPDGSFSYTPDANWYGADSFEYISTSGTSGLTHFWGLEGNGTDSVGGANGTLVNGPTTISGVDGEALQFDGANDHVALPDITYTNEFTLAFYFKVDDNSGTGIQYFYSQGTVGANNVVHVSLVENGYFDAGKRDNLVTTILDGNDPTSSQHFYNISGLINDGQWHSYAVTTLTGDGTVIYIDGVAVGKVSSGGDAINPVGGAYIGARSDLDPTRQLNAGTSMDSIAIYNRALSAAEVASLDAASPQATVTLTVNPVNDAPSITNGASVSMGTSYSEDSATAGFSVSTVINSAGWSDPDSGAVRGMIVTGSTGNGTWQYSTDNVTWHNVGSVSSSNGLLLSNTSWLRYIGDGQNGETPTVNFRAWDMTSGTASTNATPSYTNPGAGGGSTAFSTGTATAQTTIYSVNDAPVLDDAPNIALTSQNEDSGAPSGVVGTWVSSLADLPGSGGALDNVTDVDTGAVTGIAITAANTTNGSWWYSINGGGSWNALGAVSNSNARLLAADANTLVYFQPNANFNGTINSALTYRAWDRSSGTNGGLADASSNGGTTAFSTATETADLMINPVNDAPVGVPTITGTVQEDQTLTADTSSISDADGLGVFSYQWLRDGGVIGGATSNTYTLGDADVGTQISVRVTYADGHGTAEGPLTSAQTAAVTNVNDVPVGVPTITGTVQEDQTLTADTSGISDDDGLGIFSYQWLRDGVAIGGATSSTYTLGDLDVGTQISVRVTYTDGNGTSEGPLTSAQTAPVTNINDVPVITSDGGGASASLNVAENSTFVTTITSTDADGDTPNYSIIGGTDADKFMVDIATGDLTFAVPPNFEYPSDSNGDNVYQVQVQVDDGNGGTDTQTITVTVTDVVEGNNTPVASSDPSDYNTTLLDFNPIGYWRLGEAVGPTAVDAGSAANNGTYNGTTLGAAGAITGDSDTAADFDRVAQDYVEIAHDNAYLIDSGTIQLWFNADDLASPQALISKDSTNYDTGGHLIIDVKTDGSIEVRQQSNSNDNYINTAAGTVSAGNWYQLTYTFGAQGMQLYLNGELVGTNSYTGGLGTSSGGAGNYEPIVIGASQRVSGDLVATPLQDFFDGKIDEVAIIGNQLNAQQVKQLYGAGVQHYTLAENTTLNVAASEGVLVNDYDQDGDPITAVLVSGPSNASSFTLNADGSFSYTPTAGFDGTDSFTYRANDGSLDSAPVTVTLTITGVNDAPTAANNTVTTNEDTTYTFNAVDFNFSDPEGDALASVEITSLETVGALQLSGVDVVLNQVISKADIDAGNLTFVPVADANGAGYDSFGFSVNDGALDSVASYTTTVDVTAVNDAPFNVTVATVSLSDGTDTTGGYNLGALSSTDPDSGDTFTYSILGGTDQAHFTLGGAGSNELIFDDGVIDLATQSSYSVIVRTTDSGGLTFDKTLTINVSQVLNDALLLISTENDVSGSGAPGLDSWGEGDALNIANPGLNFEPGVSGGTFSVNFSLANFSDNGSAKLQGIHYVTADITVGGGANTFDLQAGDLLLISKDGETLHSSDASTLDVTDRDVFVFRPDTTDDYSSGVFYMLLNDAVGKEMRAISLVEKDTLVGDTTLTAGTFLIARDGGSEEHDVRLFTATGIGMGTTTGTETLLLDGDTDLGIGSKVMGIELIETDTVIGGTTLSAGNILLTIDNREVVGGNSLSVTEHDIFYLDVSTTVVGSGFSAANAYLLLEGLDVGLDHGDEDIYALSLNVRPNVAPTAADNTVSTDEDTAYTFAATDFSFSDADGDTLASVQITSLESVGALQLNGVDVVLNQVISRADIDAGNLTFVPVANANGVSYDSFGFSVNDGTLDSAASYTMTIDVTAVNDAPVITSDGGGASASVNVAENTTTVTTVTSSDVDGGVPTYTITGGADAALFGINATSGELSFLAAPDFEVASDADVNGVYEVEVTVSDGNTGTDTQAISVTVTPVNDNTPTITSDGGGATASLNVAENTSSVTTVTTTDADLPAETLTYSIAGGADAALFSINSSSGALSFSAAPDREVATDFDGDHIYEVTVQVSDGSLTDTQAISVTVTDVDEFNVSAPSDLDATANAVDENASNGTSVGITASANDADATTNSVTYSLFDDAGGRFAIDANTGVVTVANGLLLDRESAASHDITVRATSADGSTADTLFTIALNDVDEFDVGAVTDTNANANTVAEDAIVGTLVGVTANAADADATNNTITYALDDDAGGLFAIDTNSGVVTVNAALDYESATSHSITVRATSTDGSFSTQAFTINVTDVNESSVSAVSDTDASADTVAEDAIVGTTVGITGFADDPDGSDTVTYSLSDDAGGLFTIDANSGVVTVANPLDYETATSHSITVLATSTDTSTSSQVFTISVTDVNEGAVGAISDTDATADAVNENAFVGTTVGITAFADDPDGTDSVSYSLDDDAGGLFAIDAGTGVVTVAGVLDAESATSHNITVRATSTDTSFSTQSFVIAVNDLDEFDITAVSDADGTADSVDENAAIGTTVGVTAFADDTDATDTVSYSLDDNAGGLFAIDAGTGVVTVAGALDAESATSHNITVRATSTDGSFNTQAYTIAVNDLDEFDVTAIADSDGTIDAVDENVAIGTTVGVTAFAGDADVTDSVTYTLDDNAGGLFAIDAGTGVVTVAGALDAEASTSHNVTVRATSTDGSFSTQAYTIAVNDLDEFDVTAVSDTDGTADAVDENAAIGTTVGVTASASDSDVTDTVSYSLDDDAGGLFAIDSGTGVVTVAGALDAETATSHSITVRATSTDSSFSTQAYTIAVNDLDEFDVTAIGDTDGTADAVDENAVIGTTVGITAFADDADVTDSVSYSLDDNADGLFAIDSGTGVVTVAGALDAEAATSHSITVRATSTDSSFSTQAFTITVNDLDEFDITAVSDTDATADAVDENALVGSTVGVTAFADDADISDSVSYSLDDNAGGRFAIGAGTGVVTVAGALDAEAATSHNITVRATSTDGSFSTQNYTIAINDVNEFGITAVSDTDATADAVDENASIGTTAGITAFADDSDVTDTVSYSLDDNAGGRFAIDAGTGVVTVAGALDAEAAISHNITVRATSTDGSFNTQNYTIAVNDLDEFDTTAVSDADGTADSVDENAAIGTTVGVTAFADDADVTDTVSYSLDDNAGGRFAIDAGTGVVTVASALDAEAATSHNVTVRATSTDGSFSTQAYTIAVNDLDEFDVTGVSDTDATTDAVDENAAIGTTVGITAFADDADVTDSISYSLDDNAGGLFTIDAGSGLVTVAGALDAETALSHNITVRATSSDGSFSTQAYTIAVNDLDEFDITTVSDTDATVDAVDENSAIGTVVGITAFADDSDATDSISYTLDDDAGGLFTIDSGTGVVTVAGALDAETATSHSITVRATSTDGSFSTQAYTIAVNDLDEFDVTAISDTDAAIDAVDENSAIGTTVGVTASASDSDVTDTVSYSLDDNAGGLFAIDSGTGVVTVAGALDAETASSHNITVRATSTDGSFSTQAYTIAVNDVDEFDVTAISDTDGSADAVDENAVIGTTVGITAFADDPDATDSISYSLDDNAGGLFAIDTGTGVVTVADALDAESATSHSITVRATSTDGSFSTQAYTVAVNDLDEFDVTAVSDTDATIDAVDENSAIGTVVGLTAFADDSDITDTVSYSLDDNAGGLFTIDAGSGVVTVAGALDAEASTSHTITVRATSTDGSFNTQNYSIAVNDLDEFDITAVSDTDATVDAVDENAAIGTTVGITAFADDADITDSVSYSLDDNAGGRFAIDGATGVVTVAGSLDYETATSYNITVRATSTDGSISTQTYSIGLNDLNDNAPTIVPGQSFSLPEDATTGASVGSVSATDADTVGTLQNWQILSGNTDGIFAIDATTGEITVADPSALDFESQNSYTLSVQVSDGVSNSAIETLVINITNVNEAPTTTGIADVAVSEDAPDTVIDLFAAFDDTEQSDAELTFSVVGNSNPGLFNSTAIDPISGQLRLNYGADQNGSAQLTIRATDPLGLWIETGFDVSVAAANDAPFGSVPGSQTTQSNTALVFSSANANRISVADVDAQSAEIQVDLSTQRGTLSLASTQGLTFLSGDGTQDAQISIRGTVTAVNAALNGLTFSPQKGWAGSTNVQIRVDDLGNSGSGGALADIRTVAVQVLGSDTGPTPTTPATPGTGPSTPPPVDSFILDLEDDDEADDSAPIDIDGSSESIAADTENALQSEEVRLFGDSASVFANIDLADDDTRRALGKFVKVKQLSFGTEQAGIIETLKFLGENGQALVDHVIWGRLDDLSHQMNEVEKEDLFNSDSIAFKTATGISFTLSAGYVAWLLNSGSLAASMLSLTPLWTHFDPIPVTNSSNEKGNLRSRSKEEGSNGDSASENRSVEELFDNGSN